MVVLNFYGKIEPICISKKLGLYIANLPNEEHNEWRDELADEIELAVKADRIYQEKNWDKLYLWNSQVISKAVSG